MRPGSACAIRCSVTERPRPSKTTLVLLLVPVVGTSILSLVGTALAPALIVESPLGLVALNAQFRHLILATNSVDALPFFAVALGRLFLADPFYYLLGRLYGEDAVQWIERKSGDAGAVVRWGERMFARFGLLLLLVAPINLVCVLAGAARVRPVPFAIVNLLGTFGGLVLVRLFGAALADPIEVVIGFVADNVLVLTIASIVIVIVSTIVRRRRQRKLGGPVERDADPNEV